MRKQYKSGQVATELVCQYEVVRCHTPLVPTPRLGWITAIAGLLLLASVLVLFFQVQGFLSHLETRLAVEAHGDARLHAINQHVEVLQGKFNALLAESVEVRLKALEQSVANGRIGGDDLRNFETLKNDLKLLENYTEKSGGNLTDYAPQEHPRFQAMPSTQKVWRPEELRSEFLQLQNLFYLCLAVLALSFLMVTGYWFWQRHRFRRLESPAAHPLLARPVPGRR